MGAMEMSGPFWPVYLRTLPAGGIPAGMADVAVYVGPMLGILLTSTMWGRLGDRHGHRLMMLRALFGLMATQAALAFASDVASILVLRFLQGACAGYIAPAQAYGAGVVPADRRGRLFALLQVATNVGSLGGAVLGGMILDHAAFAWINGAAAVLCAGCLAAVWALLPDVRPGPAPVPSPASSPGGEGRRRRGIGPVAAGVAPVLAILGLALLARMVTQAPFSRYVTGSFGADNWLVGLCYGLLALGFVLTASGWARHCAGRSAPAVLARVCWVLAGCALVTALAGMVTSVMAFAALYLVWGSLLAATTPVLTALLSGMTGAGDQGRVLGLAQGTGQAASITGIVLGGWIGQGSGLSHTYAVVAGLYGLTLIVALLVWLVWAAGTRKDHISKAEKEGRA